MWFTLLLVTLCSLTTIHGYSSGAGQAVCQTNEMRPRHSGLNFNQNDPSVTINAVKNGNILDIEVQCRVAGGFKGYLIAIEKDGRQVGEFLISGHKAMGCATKILELLTLILLLDDLLKQNGKSLPIFKALMWRSGRLSYMSIQELDTKGEELNFEPLKSVINY